MKKSLRWKNHWSIPYKEKERVIMNGTNQERVQRFCSIIKSIILLLSKDLNMWSKRPKHLVHFVETYCRSSYTTDTDPIIIDTKYTLLILSVSRTHYRTGTDISCNPHETKSPGPNEWWVEYGRSSRQVCTWRTWWCKMSLLLLTQDRISHFENPCHH